MYGLELDL